MNATGFILIFGFFASLITYIYMKYQTRHAERMHAMRTENPDFFAKTEYNRTEQLLKNGLFLVGGGTGFILGVIVEKMIHVQYGMGIVPLTAVGAGLGFIIFYFVKKNSDSDKVEL